MHGESDHRVSLEAGIEIPELFLECGWDVTKIQHHKGHMIQSNIMKMSEWLENLV